MTAVLRRFVSGPERLRRDEADRLRQALLPFMAEVEARPQVGRAASALVAYLDRLTASSSHGVFVMIYPEQNAAVVDWIFSHSSRSHVAVRVWMLLFSHLRTDTGEVVLSRDEIAERIGVRPGDVSTVMSELASDECRALTRRRERVAGMRGPGVVRYFMNPNVFRQPALAGDVSRAGARPLELVGGSCPPTERRSRAPVVAPVVL